MPLRLQILTFIFNHLGKYYDDYVQEIEVVVLLFYKITYFSERRLP